MTYVYTIKGNTPSQKNGKNIAVNRSTGRMFVVSNPRVVKWHQSAAKQLAEQKAAETLQGPLEVLCTFYRDTRRKYDLDNAYGSVADALVHAGIIEDDNITVIPVITLQHGGHDKENPRVWIEIRERQ